MNLVATFTIGEPWYARYTIPWMRRYAGAHGADFLELRHRRTHGLASACAAWARLDVLAMFARQSEYERMLVLDADCVILPHCPDVFAGCDGTIRAALDMGMPEASERYRDWCRRYFGAAPEQRGYFNAGVIVIHRAAARALLPHLAGPYPDEPFWEQDFLNYRVQSLLNVDLLDCSFNWLAPQFSDAARAQNIVHFVGGHKGLIPPFCAGLAEMVPAEVGA